MRILTFFAAFCIGILIAGQSPNHGSFGLAFVSQASAQDHTLDWVFGPGATHIWAKSNGKWYIQRNMANIRQRIESRGSAAARARTARHWARQYRNAIGNKDRFKDSTVNAMTVTAERLEVYAKEQQEIADQETPPNSQDLSHGDM